MPARRPRHTLGLEAIRVIRPVTGVRGRFKDFTGEIEVEDEDLATAAVRGTIKTASVDTGVEQRDAHLRSADFLDVEKYPEIAFESTRVLALGNNRYRVMGRLTIKGQSREIELDAVVSERFKDPWGNERAGIRVTGTLNRKDWGLTWNMILEAGRLLVGDEVDLEIEGEVVRKLEAVALAS